MLYEFCQLLWCSGIDWFYLYPSGLLHCHWGNIGAIVWLPHCLWIIPEKYGYPWNIYPVHIMSVPILLCLFIDWFYPYPSGFTHILQGYFTAIVAIMWLPQYQWSNPERYGSIIHTNLNKTICIFYGMYSIMVLGLVSLTVFPSQFKFNGNFLSLSSRF